MAGMEVEKKLITNSFFYVLPKFAGIGINIMTLPILTRILSPQDFGAVAMATVFSTFAVGIFSWGLPIAVQRYFFEYRRDPVRLGRYLFTCQFFLHLVLLVSSAPIYIFRNAFSTLFIGNPGYGNAFFTFYVSTFFFFILNVYLTTLQNFENAKVHSFFTIFHAVVLGGLNVTLSFSFKDYTGLMYASIASSFGVSALCTLYFFKYFRNVLSFEMLKESLVYGAQNIPKSFTGFIGRFFDKYLINKVLTLQAVGVYNIGQSLGNSSISLLNTIWSSFQPLCYRQVFDQGPKASRPVGRLFSYFLFATASPLLLVLLFSSEIVRLLAPPAYQPAVDVIMIFLCAMSTNIFGMYVGVQYAYAKKPLYIVLATTMGTLVNVGMNLLLIPRWGLVGASLGALVSYATINGLLTVIGQSLYRIHYEWGFVACVYGIIGLSTLAGLLMRATQISYGVQLCLKICLFGALIFAGSRWKVATMDTARKIVRLLKPQKGLSPEFRPVSPH
ncbi:MAG: polysaccharide biosynthesis protein [Elusimicrobia bacterium]|nr:polysaccharide biosynthesis protein [Elusimicrobiota bacterium]